MAWVCDYCGAPPESWSGGQGSAYVCSDPGCYSHIRREQPFEETHETLRILVCVSKKLLDAGEVEEVAGLVAQDAANIARKGVRQRMNRV